jgi:hypothetical protein
MQCNPMHPTLISILLCLTPDDFTRQVEGAASQWVKWNIILIALNKGDFPFVALNLTRAFFFKFSTHLRIFLGIWKGVIEYIQSVMYYIIYII